MVKCFLLINTMPEYSFQSTDGQIKDIFYFMKDVPSVGAEITDDQGVKWKRIFTSPRAAIDTQSDPYSAVDFKKQFSDNKKFTMGNMFDASREASEKRANKDGVDQTRVKYFDKYKKEHRGQEHPHQKKEKFAALQRELGINIGLR